MQEKERNTVRRVARVGISWLPGFLIFLSGWGFAAAARAADAEFNLTLRSRAPNAADGSGYEVREKVVRWDAKKTAVIICDMWDQHWCRGASRRVAEMAPKMDRVVAAARERGALIIHAPSDCMEYYKDTPQRKLAQQAPQAKNAPRDIDAGCRRLDREAALPIDDSDGGCDCQPPCKHGNPWRKEIDALHIAPGDAVSASGREIWNLMEQRGIENVLMMGVHTNMCVVGRSFGLRNLAKSGKNVVLVRDLTDSMYNHLRAPFVDHRRGTELVIQHIEKHVCPSTLSADVTGAAGRPHVVFLIGEDEYKTKDTLPAFARKELEPRGVRCTLINADEKDPNNFPGVGESLKDADLLVLSVRRRTPTTEQLAAVRAYLDSGKPLVGIRTASHAFDKVPPAGHASWSTLDRDVLGGHYLGHYGNVPGSGHKTQVSIAPGRVKHPILAGLPEAGFASASHLYKCRDLAKSTTPLLIGRIDDQPEREPVAWTNTYKGGRVFYTSLGSPADFELPAFRRLLLNAVFWAMERQAPSSRSAKIPSAE